MCYGQLSEQLNSYNKKAVISFDMVWAVVRPENSFLSTKRKDIYVDYFESREEADQHVKDAQDA